MVMPRWCSFFTLKHFKYSLCCFFCVFISPWALPMARTLRNNFNTAFSSFENIKILCDSETHPRHTGTCGLHHSVFLLSLHVNVWKFDILFAIDNENRSFTIPKHMWTCYTTIKAELLAFFAYFLNIFTIWFAVKNVERSRTKGEKGNNSYSIFVKMYSSCI